MIYLKYSVPFTCFDYKIAQIIFCHLLSIAVFNATVQRQGAHHLPSATESRRRDGQLPHSEPVLPPRPLRISGSVLPILQLAIPVIVFLIFVLLVTATAVFPRPR